MKEPKLGDKYYKSMGLVKFIGWMNLKTSKLYDRAAKKKNWSKTKYNSFHIKRTAPK